MLQLRYGLLDGKRHGLIEVARMARCSREQARQLEVKGLWAICGAVAKRYLCDWMQRRMERIGHVSHE